MLHQSNFNFNDDLIDIASRFWVLVAKDRLEIKWSNIIRWDLNIGK